MWENRNASLVDSFTSSSYGGLGLDHIAAFQGFGWVQYLMGHLRYKSNTGHLMKMLIEFTQLECWCPDAIFETSYMQYKPTILTSKWVNEIWAYLELCSAKHEKSLM
jgi:hypothetical protein